MRRLLSALLAAGLALAAPACGAPPADAKQTAEEFKALKKEYEEAQNKIDTARDQAESDLEDAKTDAEKAAIRKRIDALDYAGLSRFSDRFLSFAEGHPESPSAQEALALALAADRGAPDKPPAWGGVIGKLRSDFVAKPAIAGVLPLLGASVADPDALALVRDVMAKNPDHKTQARACKALARGRRTVADMATRVKADDRLRAELERRRGKDFADKLVAGADDAAKEANDMEALLRDRFADVYPDLSVGKAAPEVVSQDLDGKEVKLSALRGKVVVVDVWATWCGPCRAMIPHEKEMVDRLKDRPFVLVGISLDENRDDVAKFVAGEGMSWTHWWNGAQGGIAEDWDIRGIPATYVLGAKGVIRFKDLRGPELEEAVSNLLKEMGEKK